MFKKIASFSAVLTLGLGHALAQSPAPAAAPAPAWKQGMGADMANSTLAPLAGKLTVTPAADIPINKLKLPPGFKAEIWSTGTPGIRAKLFRRQQRWLNELPTLVENDGQTKDYRRQ